MNHINKIASEYVWNEVKYPPPPKKKSPKTKAFERKLHLGRLEFLLGADASADPTPPELDDAVFELITDKTLFSPINKRFKKEKPNKAQKRVSLDQSLEISDRERERERDREREMGGNGSSSCCSCSCC
jgi:thiazolylpeptide-type bacteriocin precursor